MTIRAKRLLNAVARATITPQQFAQLVGESGRTDEFIDLLARAGQADLITSSAPSRLGCALASSLYTRLGAAGRPYTAIAADSVAIGKYCAGLAGLVPGDYADVTAVAASATAMAAVAASATAMAAVIASATAMAAVAASATAMAAVIASATAMAAVIASATAMAAVAASATAKTAIYNSDTAITEIAGSATALAAIRAAAGYSVLATANGGGSRSWPGVAGGTYLIVGVSTSDATTGQTITVSTRRAGSTRANTNTTAVDNVTLTTALGPICCPCEGPFTVTTTDGNSQTIYLGALRCDA
jgi:hypothetical protein